MGRPKQSLPWMGLPLLRYQVIESGRTAAEEVVVVLGNDADEHRSLLPEKLERARLVVVENPDYALGKTTSVKAGMAIVDVSVDAVVPMAGDSPRSAGLLDQLVGAHFEGGKLITYPWHRGTEGHPGIFSMELREELLGIDEATRGIRGVTERDPDRVNRVEFDDPMAVVNLNNWEDYENALRRTGQPVPQTS
jgi:molybdenum cofactor cytidylyltransferase